MWIHYHLNFAGIKAENSLDSLQYRELMVFFRKILKMTCVTELRRKFFLFEDVPHVFLALEIIYSPKAIEAYSSEKFLKRLNRIKPSFVNSIEFVEKGGDEVNGETFLDVMNAFADAEIYSKKRASRQSEIPHIVHCVLNQHGLSTEREIEFHKLRAAQINSYQLVDKLYKFYVKSIDAFNNIGARVKAIIHKT